MSVNKNTHNSNHRFRPAVFAAAVIAALGVSLIPEEGREMWSEITKII